MFDKTEFIDAARSVEQALSRLGDAAKLARGAIPSLNIKLGGRGVPKLFRDEVLKTGIPESGHGHILVSKILDKDLPAALKRLRSSHARASGGADRTDWADATMQFNLERDGTVSLWYSRHNMRGLGRNMPTGPQMWTCPELAEMLSHHAALDLAGSSRTFAIGTKGNGANPFIVKAPDPARAIARLNLFLGWPPETCTHLLEVFEPEDAIREARALLPGLP